MGGSQQRAFDSVCPSDFANGLSFSKPTSPNQTEPFCVETQRRGLRLKEV